METVTPKVHHHRRRRSGSRQQARQQHRRNEQQQNQQEPHQLEEEEERDEEKEEQEEDGAVIEGRQQPEQRTALSCEEIIDDGLNEADPIATEARLSRATSAGTTTSTLSRSSSQQTVLLVNGEAAQRNGEPITIIVVESPEVTEIMLNDDDIPPASETIGNEMQTKNSAGNNSRNSSGDAQSLKETLQQLRPPKKHSNGSGSIGSANNSISAAQQHRSHHHSHHHHHHRERERDRQHRTRSPRENSATGSVKSTSGGGGGGDGSERVGILGFMEREMRQSSPTQLAARSAGVVTGPGAAAAAAAAAGGGVLRKVPSSLSDDPQASPAQRSIRSRSSLEKSPRRKRSKSESRRRRERKLIAAGEMEVRQANETLMRYLKQCSEMNDASLSGELEIDLSYDERRVHRKTKSERDKRGHLISKLYTAGGGLSSLLKELSDDIIPAEGEEIYNPFTPVVSPTEDNAPAHIDKMFMQTSSGYRPVERCYYKHHHHHIANGGGFGGEGSCCGGETPGLTIAGNGNGPRNKANSGIAAFIGPNARGRHFSGVGGTSGVGGSSGSLRHNGSYGDDVHCLLETDECNRHKIRTSIQLACFVQRIWLLVSNICHGLLAGLALAHLLFVLSSPHPMDWAKIFIAPMTTLSGEVAAVNADSASDGDSSSGTSNNNSVLNASSMATSATTAISHAIINDYLSFAGIYLNTFYCLTILCLVSVFDRMDICRWDLSNASEFISFRWLIIAMIYVATIILTICSDTINGTLIFSNNINTTIVRKELVSNSILNIWSSLSVTRSISAICGWIMIGLSPHEDLLYEHLVDLTKYQFTNN